MPLTLAVRQVETELTQLNQELQRLDVASERAQLEADIRRAGEQTKERQRHLAERSVRRPAGRDGSSQGQTRQSPVPHSELAVIPNESLASLCFHDPKCIGPREVC